MRKLIALLMLIAGGGTAIADAPWSARGIVAFRDFLFDFDYMTLRTPFGDTSLLDCSDQASFCINNKYMSFALPRRCADLGDAHWQARPHAVKVIGQFSYGIGHYEPADHVVFLLQNPERPQFIIEYEIGSGIRGISFDAAAMDGLPPAVDLPAAIAAGTYEADRSRKWRYAGRLTSDAFAACA